MKKLILSGILLLAAAGAARAQGPRFGLKAGVSLANITGDHVQGTQNLVGAVAGGMADFTFSDYLSFHPELLFSQKGVKVDRSTAAGDRLTGQDRTSYLDAPLLLRVRASGLFFEVGPQVGVLVAERVEQTYTYPGSAPRTYTSTSTNGTRRVDVGYVAGVGYQLPQGLELGVRYNGGFLDLSDPSGSSKSRNSVFQLQVGYLFGGK